jgi:CTP synthase
VVKQQTKYIFVTGGVLSGLGKGITAASIGNILKARGLSVNIQKLDPYLNVDAGTLNPAEHGECFVTADGAETDLDLGHYERFLDVQLTRESSVMSGRILRDLIQAERDGKFLGKTVQVVPHFTDSIQEHILAAAKGNDVHIVEIGGTVGDYESPPFYEAIREIATRVGRENCLYVQVLYLPYLGTSKETKTKPAQNAVRDLRAVGVVPDVLVARSEHVPTTDVAAKLSAFASVPQEAIVVLPNAETVYEVPLTLEKAGIGDFITRRLAIKAKKPDMKDWQSLVKRALDTSISEVRVGVVAKYLDNEDTYMSVFEALNAAGYAHGSRVKIEWIDAEVLSKKNVAAQLGELDGILVPGGFGTRGVEGKIIAAGHAMEHKIPYLGLCLGMQVAVVAMARKLGYDANSLEVDPQTKCPVIYIMNGQEAVKETGGTMRLGDYECVLAKGTLAAKLYGQKTIMERHRHRYEFNNQYREELEAAGMIMAGVSPDNSLVELIELKDHPFYIASQFHPEFKSRPNKPHPLFSGFIAAIQN